jgi:hypothetical protein
MIIIAAARRMVRGTAGFILMTCPFGASISASFPIANGRAAPAGRRLFLMLARPAGFGIIRPWNKPP